MNNNEEQRIRNLERQVDIMSEYMLLCDNLPWYKTMFRLQRFNIYKKIRQRVNDKYKSL